jgi:hypothetical protein
MALSPADFKSSAGKRKEQHLKLGLSQEKCALNQQG